MKKVIVEKLNEGWTEEQIIDFFVQRYGNEILLYPGNKFLNYIPFFIFGIGFLFLTLIVIRNRKRGTNKTN